MNMFKDFVLPPLVLTIICIVVSVSLVGAFNVTDPVIKENAAKAAQKARSEVLPGSSSFEEVKIPLEEMPEGGVNCYKATDGNGYVITGVARGYGGEMQVMVGIKNDGSIAGVKVLKQNETAGLGTQVTEKKFTDRFVGSSVEMKDIQMISGATVSSRAFMNAVKGAYKVYGQVAGVAISDSEPVRDPLTLANAQKIFADAKTLTRVKDKLEAYRVNESTGYIVVTSGEGFGGNMVVAVGYDNDGKIVGMAVTEISETPEYGMAIAKADYLAKYTGLADITGVEKIAGATVTSDAFQKIVQKTLEAFPAVKIAPEPASLLKLSTMLTEIYGDAGTPVGIANMRYALRVEGATGVVVSTEGFGGEYEVIVIVDDSGKIVKTAMGRHNETDGYGTQCAATTYTDRYTGKDSGEAVDKVEDIAGATITSKSFKYAVKLGLEAVKGAK